MSTTVNKALKLLEVLAVREQMQSLSELSHELNWQKSNVHFILSALISNSFVEQDPTTKRYFATLKLWELGIQVLGRLDLRRIASPYLASLAESTSETVNLAILDHDEVVYVHKIDSPMPVRAYTPEGRRAPAYCTSTGKAILAHQSEDVIKRVAARIKPHTDRTVTTARQLITELQQVRKTGYSMNRGEWYDSVRGIAVPVMDSHGRAIAAIGVFGPAERLTSKRLNNLAKIVLRTGHAVSQALGHRP